MTSAGRVAAWELRAPLAEALAAEIATERALNGLLLGLGATSCVGALAGLFPALGAARLSPTDALGAV
jgi:ABC-type lipoprotein release transport system permease subunit